MTDRMIQVSTDSRASLNRHVNEELSYTGYELKWQDTDDPEFMEVYEEKLSEEMDRRVPKILQGSRPVKIIVTAYELHNPGALARNLVFGNSPSIKIDVTVQDVTEGQPILSYSDKLVDTLYSAPTGSIGGISFRLQSVSARLAGATVQSLMGKLREL